MTKLVKGCCLIIIIIGAFYIAGHMGMWMENLHDNLAAGASTFSISFLSIIGGFFRFWSDLFT